jgi:hypothetical protein
MAWGVGGMSGDAQVGSITRVVEFHPRQRASPDFVQELRRMGASPRMIQAAKGEIGAPTRGKSSQEDPRSSDP